jgi:ABC-type multidrug transport system ATPase subunit
MLLEIKNLSKTYSNGVKALNDINLSIGTGMFGLLGPNGAGKSSLMRTIATLQTADKGSITFDGIDVQQNPQALREVLGYLPQEFGVYPRISAEMLLDHLAALKGIDNKKERKELVEAMLQRVNLFKVRSKYLSTYSGGMKQRFGIAQALIGNPKLIIVDEPTAGLDPAERNRFYNLLSELGENTVVILSTHIVEDVSTLCSDMAVICLGEVMEQGHPLEVVKKMEGKAWRKIVSRNEVEQYRNEFRVIASHLRAGKILLHIYAETDPGNGFERISPNLEDAYFSTISSKVDLVTI